MKKAKIDVLDIVDSLDEKPSDDLVVHEPDLAEPQIDLQNESFLVDQGEEETPSKWRFLTWKTVILFGIPAICLILAITFILIYFVYYYNVSDSRAAKQKKSGPPAVAVITPVYLDNLAAIVRDVSGKEKLVLFSLALKPGKGASQNFGGNNPDLRMGVTKIIGDALLPDLMHDQGRDLIKKRIKAYIESLKGSGALEGVWITSWTVL